MRGFVTIAVVLLVLFVVAVFIAGSAPIMTRLETELAQAEADADTARANMLEEQKGVIEAQGHADTERMLAKVAADAVTRQGRLLTMYVVAGSLRTFVGGVVTGALGAVAVFLLWPRIDAALKIKRVRY